MLYDEDIMFIYEMLGIKYDLEIKKDYPQKETTNPDMCAECGGKCCKKCGCHFSPDDFNEVSFDELKKEIEKGYISIDYVPGEMILSRLGCYILRIRNVDAPIVDIGFKKRAQCMLLTKQGCKLEYNNRPTGGRLLIPSDKGCSSKYDIDMCCREWKPHQEVLIQLKRYFKDKQCS